MLSFFISYKQGLVYILKYMTQIGRLLTLNYIVHENTLLTKYIGWSTNYMLQ
ncbi:hypothetical protein SZ39_3896 [Bacillus mycoides]|nr:hypothetical protein SZ39_3896 [Bacillus mycoides]